MFKKLSYKAQKEIIIVLFTIIPILMLAIFTYYPLLRMIEYSFTNWDGLAPTFKFVGLKNYITIFTDPNYFEVFGVSAYYLVATFIQLALALYFATILSSNVKFKSFFKEHCFFHTF